MRLSGGILMSVEWRTQHSRARLGSRRYLIPKFQHRRLVECGKADSEFAATLPIFGEQVNFDCRSLN
jgi:hypothetical protein